MPKKPSDSKKPKRTQKRPKQDMTSWFFKRVIIPPKKKLAGNKKKTK